jgi:penicillin-binding protein 2
MVSCDVFMYTIGVKLGIVKIAENLRRFGFGQKTGVEIQEEMPGLVPSDAWKRRAHGAPWFPGDTVATSIGQGYSTVTPLQLAQATAIVANRGIRYRPTLLLKTQKPDGSFIQQPPIPEPPVVLNNPHTWEVVFQGMEGVIENPQGTAYPLWNDIPYTAAGKTGTAQVWRSGSGKINPASLPYNLRNHSLFIVYAPVDNPQIALAVVAEHSLVTAKEIARKIMDYYMLTELRGAYNTKRVTRQ